VRGRHRGPRADDRGGRSQNRLGRGFRDGKTSCWLQIAALHVFGNQGRAEPGAYSSIRMERHRAGCYSGRTRESHPAGCYNALRVSRTLPAPSRLTAMS